jgi:hypothetical protein
MTLAGVRVINPCRCGAKPSKSEPVLVQVENERKLRARQTEHPFVKRPPEQDARFTVGGSCMLSFLRCASLQVCVHKRQIDPPSVAKDRQTFGGGTYERLQTSRAFCRTCNEKKPRGR